MNNKKKVLIISSPDINNAAGIITYDLFKGLSKIYDVQLLIKYSKFHETEIVSYYNKVEILIKKIKQRLLRKTKIIERDINYYFFDLNLIKRRININRIENLIQKPDIIIAYFMQNFFSMVDLYHLQLKFNVPILLFMADRVYLTGGCHYFWNCEGFINFCENCPAIIDVKHKHYAMDNLLFNKKIIETMNVSLITGSTEDFSYAKKSTLFRNKNVYKILGGIDLSIFHPNEKREDIRLGYKINNNDFVILYGAVNINEKRKGFSYFYDIVKQLAKKSFNKNIVILTIGKGDAENKLKNINIKQIHLGYISDYNKLAEIYNISDVLLSTTIQDSGPMMINQSLACGTPVVSFNIGVAQDIVIEGKTGYKSDLYNTEGLLKGLIKLINQTPQNITRIRKNCVDLAKKNFSKEIVASQFINIIENLK